VGELLRWTTDRFASIDLSTPRVDAEHLLSHALGCRRVELYLQHDRLLDESERGGFRELVRRRLAREPVAHIEGVRGFHALDLDLLVDGRVLIPRPETEHLVDWVLETLTPSSEAPPSEAPSSEPPSTVLDVGTGSGAIALALKHSRPALVVTASDASPEALTVARANAERHKLDVRFEQADLLVGLEVPAGGWRIIAANLPYVASSEIAGLEPEVREFEPRSALDGGDDGLDLVRALIAQIVEFSALSPDGSLFLEIGVGQADATERLLVDAGFGEVQRRRDLAGIERVLRAHAP
jgi:release factor glutamine methyltransferase